MPVIVPLALGALASTVGAAGFISGTILSTGLIASTAVADVIGAAVVGSAVGVVSAAVQGGDLGEGALWGAVSGGATAGATSVIEDVTNLGPLAARSVASGLVQSGIAAARGADLGQALGVGAIAGGGTYFGGQWLSSGQADPTAGTDAAAPSAAAGATPGAATSTPNVETRFSTGTAPSINPVTGAVYTPDTTKSGTQPTNVERVPAPGTAGGVGAPTASGSFFVIDPKSGTEYVEPGTDAIKTYPTTYLEVVKVSPDYPGFWSQLPDGSSIWVADRSTTPASAILPPDTPATPPPAPADTAAPAPAPADTTAPAQTPPPADTAPATQPANVETQVVTAAAPTSSDLTLSSLFTSPTDPLSKGLTPSLQPQTVEKVKSVGETQKQAPDVSVLPFYPGNETINVSGQATPPAEPPKPDLPFYPSDETITTTAAKIPQAPIEAVPVSADKLAADTTPSATDSKTEEVLKKLGISAAEYALMTLLFGNKKASPGSSTPSPSPSARAAQSAQASQPGTTSIYAPGSPIFGADEGAKKSNLWNILSLRTDQADQG
jgi:hypothetical protein